MGALALRFGAVLALVLLDKWSKVRVFEWLGVDPERFHHATQPLFGTSWLSFASSCNGGAAFGQFSQFPKILVFGRIGAVLFLTWLLARPAAHPRLVLVAMTLVLAGALGNLIDNLGAGCVITGHPFEGVRDFIEVYFGPLGIDRRFPAFNVADSCITVGACFWLLSGFLHKEPASAEPKS